MERTGAARAKEDSVVKKNQRTFSQANGTRGSYSDQTLQLRITKVLRPRLEKLPEVRLTDFRGWIFFIQQCRGGELEDFGCVAL